MLKLSRTVLGGTAFAGAKGGLALSRRPKLACLAALLLVAFPGSIRAATVTIDGSQTYQVIDGFGVNANHRSWNTNELPPVLDALIDQAGMTLFHVIFDNNNWEANNDNSDPNVMDWSYYNSVYSAPEFQKLWGIMTYLNQRGITNGLVPELQGPVALWMGGLSLTPGFENEYAETIASLLVYARNAQHLQFSVVGPVNEPDAFYSGIHLSGADQYVTVMHNLAQQLDANGLGDVRFSGPDLAYTSTAWLGAMMGDPLVMAKLARFGLHSYLHASYDATGVTNFIQQSAYPDRHFWMTEFNVWCQSCQTSVSGDDSWAYARGTATCLLDHLANGASAGLVWEGYDSEFVDFNPADGGNDPPHWSYWGLFKVDDPNAAVRTYTPRKGFYTLAQIARFVRPGVQRIDVSGASTPLTLLAFYNTNSGQFTLTGANTDSIPTTLSGTLTNLPAMDSLELYYTDSTNDLFHSGTFPLTNGRFDVPVPADCIFTLTTINPNLALPAIALTSPANDAIFAAPATISLAADVAANGHSITSVQFYEGTTLLGEDTNAPYTFTWSGVPAGTYSLTARLGYDAGSALSSAAANVTVTNLPPPAITLTSPANDAIFAAPATISLAADVIANGHSITSVQFYDGTALLDEDTNAPYTFTWSSVPAGTYSLTARLIYDAGGTLSSAAANMTVTNPPPPRFRHPHRATPFLSAPRLLRSGTSRGLIGSPTTCKGPTSSPRISCSRTLPWRWTDAAICRGSARSRCWSAAIPLAGITGCPEPSPVAAPGHA